MSVITFAEVLERRGISMKHNVQRPATWDWSPEKLTPIRLVAAFKKVSEDTDAVVLARLNCVGNPDANAIYHVQKSELDKVYINMGNDHYGVPIDGTLSAVIANQPMVLTDEARSFDFGIGEGTAIVKGDRGHGGQFMVYPTHQYVHAG